MSYQDLYLFFQDNEPDDEPLLCPWCHGLQDWTYWLDNDCPENRLVRCIFEDCDQLFNVDLASEPQTVTEEVRALLGEGPKFGTAAWFEALPLIDPETGETENL